MQIVIDNDNRVIGWGTVTVGESTVDGEGVTRANITHNGGRLGGANMAVVQVVSGIAEQDLSDGEYAYDPQTGAVEAA